MKMFGCSLCLLLLLSCLAELVDSRRLHLGSCAVSVHTHELRQYYADIRPNAIAGDSEMAVKLLQRPVMKDVQDGETCCFLRLLLRFYVERVFSSYSSTQAEHQRSASALANAFLSIRRDLRLCHCHCGEETQRTIDSLHAEFIKLDSKQAALKAVGELDTLLDWVEGLSPTSHA
ncbi:interleukin 19 like [Centroberyx affinis]|uniref:interleukin 19 like n=1 Tax=Centroberyx affinis TaxID=166261 RepID=UPI003A5C2303